MNWDQFAAATPEFAAFGWERFEKHRVVLLLTIRKDGSPRLSPLEVPVIVDGQILLGMMYRSNKAKDLLRDPRCVLHNAVTNPECTDQEFKLRGRAIEVNDQETRQKFAVAVKEKLGFEVGDEPMHLFAFDVESAGAVKIEDEKMWTRAWPNRDEWSVRDD